MATRLLATKRWPLPVVAVMVFAVAAGAALYFRGRSGNCAELGPLESFARDTVSFAPCVPAFVVNRNGRLTVYLALAPHLANEPIEWDEDRRVFYARLHGEEFDAEGRRIGGPGLSRLFECPTEVRDGTLYVDVSAGQADEEIAYSCGNYADLPRPPNE